MVASISSLSNSAQAASYYEADDYYAEGRSAPSAWWGLAAKALGLSGPVEPDRFRALLDGMLPNGQTLGAHRGGERQHRPGWDLTFSAPKSVSILALVAGDQGLVAAHNEAVKAALAYAERYAGATRIRDGQKVAHVRTCNLVAATFRHETSRALDPQLHTHAVILNMTSDAAGTWRSVESRGLYQLQKAIGEIYRQELAMGAWRLGYGLSIGKESMFEIQGVPTEAIALFSERAAQVEAQLAKRGQTRASATAAEKQMATLDTRVAKLSVERDGLVSAWRAAADGVGFNMLARLAFVGEAKNTALASERDLILSGQGEVAAQQAVAFAAAKLGERQAVFSRADLEREAGRHGFGRVGQVQIGNAVTAALTRSDLEDRIFHDRVGIEGEGFTSATNLDFERRLLRAEFNGRAAGVALAEPIEASGLVAAAQLSAADRGRAWTIDQRRATQALLVSRSLVMGVQGYAGTAKTTTVLATYAQTARAAGYEVKALAPSASAALTLGDALDLEGQTVARHLTSRGMTKARSGRQIWLVDEASLLSARDMARLLEQAEAVGARTVLVGDVKQLGSVGAGAAFRQLQAAGMETVQLAQIVRQTNALTREAVEAALAGDARLALDALDRGGGRVSEAKGADERRTQMAADYAGLSPHERRRTIVIDPSREGRDLLTDQIRARLVEAGELGADGVKVRTLVAKDLTKAEAKQVTSYDPGDVVMFAKTLEKKGVERGVAYEVSAASPGGKAVRLSGPAGISIDWEPHRWGQVQAFHAVDCDLRSGDRIEFTRNAPAADRVNGLAAQVLNVNPATRSAAIRTERGRIQHLALDNPADQHIRHSYVHTAFAAQGRTAERVLIHAESARTNLIDQATLYVAISRARSGAAIYTDDRDKLIRALSERSGEQSIAIASISGPMRPEKKHELAASI